MKKYYIGIIVIAIATAGLVIYTITLGAGSKQDQKTEKSANEIAQKLNSYVSTNQKIPESLNEIGVKDVPSTIIYTKKSTSQYEFCVTYKTASSYGPDITSIFWGSALQGAQENYDDYGSSNSNYEPSYLYVSYYHKKGKSCQTIKPYLYGSGVCDNTEQSLYNRCYNYREQYNKSQSSSSSVVTRNTERRTDIQAVRSHLEVYNAKNGFYPTLSNLNNKSWVATNLKGLELTATCDPKNSASVPPCSFVSSSTSLLYGYAPTQDDGTACDNSSGKECTKFTLTYMEEEGSQQTVLSLN